MSDLNNSLDSDFIKGFIESGKKVNVYLSNGVKLEGYLLKEDANCFLLSNREKDNHPQLVYKNKVATINPS